MNLLAIDTSGPVAGCAVMLDGRVTCLIELNQGLTHSETLMPAVDRALTASGLSVNIYGSDLDKLQSIARTVADVEQVCEHRIAALEEARERIRHTPLAAEHSHEGPQAISVEREPVAHGRLAEGKHGHATAAALEDVHASLLAERDTDRADLVLLLEPCDLDHLSCMHAPSLSALYANKCTICTGQQSSPERSRPRVRRGRDSPDRVAAMRYASGVMTSTPPM